MAKEVAKEKLIPEPERFDEAEDKGFSVEERLDHLEAWAREPHSTPFKHGVHVVKDKVYAFYTRHDGEIERHHMFTMDYKAAKEKEPDLWTTDEPAPGVEVIDRTKTTYWERPEGVRPEERKPLTDLPAKEEPPKGPNW